MIKQIAILKLEKAKKLGLNVGPTIFIIKQLYLDGENVPDEIITQAIEKASSPEREFIFAQPMGIQARKNLDEVLRKYMWEDK